MDKNLTYEYLHGTNIYLYQRRDMFRMNTDTALLAEFMKINKGERVLDVGTNNGALLLAANRYEPSYLFGVEIQEEAAELARMNMRHHGIEHADILCADYKEASLPAVDVVVCNPPYFKVGEHSHVNERESLKIARHETYLSFPEFCEKTSSLLAEKGRCYIVHRAARVAELCTELTLHRLSPKMLQFVYDENKEEAVSVLIEAVKDGNNGCHVLMPYYLRR